MIKTNIKSTHSMLFILPCSVPKFTTKSFIRLLHIITNSRRSDRFFLFEHDEGIDMNVITYKDMLDKYSKNIFDINISIYNTSTYLKGKIEIVDELRKSIPSSIMNILYEMNNYSLDCTMIIDDSISEFKVHSNKDLINKIHSIYQELFNKYSNNEPRVLDNHLFINKEISKCDSLYHTMVNRLGSQAASKKSFSKREYSSTDVKEYMKIVNIQYHPITIGKDKIPLYPQICKVLGLSYTVNVVCDIEIRNITTNGDDILKLTKHNIVMGEIPILVGLHRDLCPLRRLVELIPEDMLHHEMLKLDENITTLFGYYLIEGNNRKLFLPQHKVRNNVPMIYYEKIRVEVSGCPGKDKRIESLVSTITDYTSKGKSYTTFLFENSAKGANDIIRFKLRHMKTLLGLNIFRLVRIFGSKVGIDNDKFFSMIASNIDDTNKAKYKTALSMLSITRISYDNDVSESIKYGSDEEMYENWLPAISENIFINEDGERMNTINHIVSKFQFSAIMIGMLLEAKAGIREISDRNEWANKALQDGSELTEELFRKTLDEVSTEFILKWDSRDGNRAERTQSVLKMPDAFIFILRDKFTNTFLKPFRSEKWGKGYSIEPKDNVIVSAAATTHNDIQEKMLHSKTVINVDKQTKNEMIRTPTFDSRGYRDIKETESNNVGLVPHVSLQCINTTYKDDSEIYKDLLQYLNFEPTTKYRYKVILTGRFIGWSNEDIIKLLEGYKRNLKYYDVAYDIRSDIIYIFTDGSRPIIPMVKSKYINDFIEGKYNSYSRQRMIEEGIVVYLDPLENTRYNNFYTNELNTLRESYDNIRKRMSELEKNDIYIINGKSYNLEAQREMKVKCKMLIKLMKDSGYLNAIENPYSFYIDDGDLGVGSSMIPFLNSNTGTRNAYHSSMVTQAVPLYHPSDMTSESSIIKKMFYSDVDPLTRDYMKDIFGGVYKGIGQNISLLINTSDGLNQEDQLVIVKGNTTNRWYKYNTNNLVISLGNMNNENSLIPFKPEAWRDKPEFDHIGDDGLPKYGAYIDFGRPYCLLYNRSRNRVKIKRIVNLGTVGKVVMVRRQSRKTNKGTYEKTLIITIINLARPVNGDKFLADSGAQKSTIKLRDRSVVPYCKYTGSIPEVIFNPLGIPSRQSIGPLYAVSTTHAMLKYGIRFTNNTYVHNYLDIVEELNKESKRMNFNPTFLTKFIDPKSQLEIKQPLVLGSTSYKLMVHQSSYKAKTGGDTIINSSGVRVDEVKTGDMDYNAFNSLRLSTFLNDSFQQTDMREVIQCKTCKVTAELHGQEYRCPGCSISDNQPGANFIKLSQRLPVTKLMLVLKVAGIDLRFTTSEVEDNQLPLLYKGGYSEQYFESEFGNYETTNVINRIAGSTVGDFGTLTDDK